MMTDAEHAAFMRGFKLAQAPGPDEADALEVASEFAPADHAVARGYRVELSKELARAILAEVEPLPEDLAGATWLGFLRGMVAQAGGAPVHVHDAGRA